MLICPICKYEYVKGITICPDCGERIVDDSSLVHPKDLEEKDWLVIYTSVHEYELQMLKDNLMSAGIDSIILSHRDRNFPVPGDLSFISLLVKKEQSEEAAKFINEVLKS
ncbi:MAG TPA: hypothetical protein ENI57_05800 [Ignavibacteria bacterium]|nr:hypothetical protein [Ignavibacteria bacterium]